MEIMAREEVLAINTIEDLRELTWRDIDRNITEQEISHIFRLCDSLWLHSGNPADPHAELTSGKCSNGFVDTLRVLCYTNLCELLAYQMIQKINGGARHLGKEWVIGSDHAGADFSHGVATWLNAKHEFTEKGPNKSQLWQRLTIEPDEVVIQAEELVTTTTTLKAVREGIRAGNAKQPVRFAPFVATLVHRSKECEFEGWPIKYLVHYDIETWDGPETCPLCKQGSKRLRPKTGGNWAELTAKK